MRERDDGSLPRRRLLQVVGAAGIGGVAGCLGDSDGEPDSDQNETDGSDDGQDADEDTDEPTDSFGEDPRVLVYSATHTEDPAEKDDPRFDGLEGNGHRHQSIIGANRKFRDMGEAFVADHPGDPSVDEVTVEIIDNSSVPDDRFPETADELAVYDVIVFNNTSRDVLFESQQEAFQAYIESGGGFVGIHSATATYLDWAWYKDLVGATFGGHPAVQEAEVRVTNAEHPSTAHLSDPWVRVDEWYDWRELPGEEVEVLLEVDTTTYDGSAHDVELLPNAWFQEGENWRSWYTAGGHTFDSWWEEDFLTHVRRGIMWAAGWDVDVDS